MTSIDTSPVPSSTGGTSIDNFKQKLHFRHLCIATGGCVHRLSLSKAWGWFAANWSFYGFLGERAVHKKFSKKFIFY